MGSNPIMFTLNNKKENRNIYIDNYILLIMNKSLIIVSVLLFATVTVSGLSVNMTPLPDNLYGGNSYELYLNFTSTESCTVSILQTEILPDPNGIDVEYSETEFTFIGNKSIIVYVTFSPYLSPEDNIDIIIKYDYTENGEKPITKRTTTYWSGTSSHKQQEPEEPWYNPPLPDPIPRVNVQDPITLTIYRAFDYTPYIFAGIGILILGSIVILIWKRKTRKKNK